MNLSTEIEQAVMKNFTKALSGSVKTGTAKIDEAIQVSTSLKTFKTLSTTWFPIAKQHVARKSL